MKAKLLAKIALSAAIFLFALEANAQDVKEKITDKEA
jgi:hypothetical protein